MAEAQQEPDLIAPEPSVRAASLPASIDPVPVPTPSRSIHHASASNIATGSAPVPPATSQLQLRRSSTGARTVRRITTEERLGEILELGRQRAETMNPGPSPPSFRSPIFRGSSNHPATPPRVGEEGEEEIPDETTGIIMKGPDRRSAPAMDYQSTAATTTARVSNTGRRRESARNNSGRSATTSHRDGDGGDAGGDAYEHNKEAEAWWKTQLAKFGSIELENKGSVARDHLALERTFLAWLRTSLSFASIGVAITQLFRLNTSLSSSSGDSQDVGASSIANNGTLRQLGKPLGAVFLGISILILFMGYQRYFQAQQWIIKGKFPASRGTIILVSLVALALMIVSLVVVLLVQPATGGS